MAGLLTYRAPVDYEQQQAAFEDFLSSYKTAGTSEDSTNGHADGDGTSDEYDFMDDAEDGEGQRSRRRGEPRAKYQELLQEIADRKRDHIYIDLDDLDEVRTC